MQEMHNKRSQSNAAHAQLEVKMRMDFLVEMCGFLTNQTLEFHKIWQKDTSQSIQVYDGKKIEI